MTRAASENIVLLGAGGHGRDVLDAARAQGRHIIGFIDENDKLHGQVINRIPVLGGLEWLLKHRDSQVILAVGNPKMRKKMADFIDLHSLDLAEPIIHPTAYVSSNAQIGRGSVVLAGTAIQPQVKIGRHVYISTVSTLGHDTIVEDFTSTNPGVQVGGETILGTGSFIGIGATVLPRLRIGEWTNVGAGAVVIHHLPPHVTAVGVPAHIIKSTEQE